MSFFADLKHAFRSLIRAKGLALTVIAIFKEDDPNQANQDPNEENQVQNQANQDPNEANQEPNESNQDPVQTPS